MLWGHESLRTLAPPSAAMMAQAAGVLVSNSEGGTGAWVEVVPFSKSNVSRLLLDIGWLSTTTAYGLISLASCSERKLAGCHDVVSAASLIFRVILLLDYFGPKLKKISAVLKVSSRSLFAFP